MAPRPVAEAVQVQDGAEVLKTLDPKEIDALFGPCKGWPQHSNLEGWVKSHDCIRSDMKDFGEALAKTASLAEGGKAVEAWQVRSLQEFWAHAEHFIHHHHDNEERIFFPWMESRVKVPPKMSTDHVTLIAEMNKVAEGIKGFRVAGNAADDARALQQIKADLAVFVKDMLEHLKEEEDQGLPLLRKFFTAKEMRTVPEKEILKGVTPADLAHVLHHMGNEAAKREWMTGMAGIPGIIISLVMMPAVRKYEKKWGRLLDDLKRGSPSPEPVKTGCFGG